MNAPNTRLRPGTARSFSIAPGFRRKPTEKALLLFHRGHEHSGRWSEVVEMLGLPDVAIFAWDARGHGRSPGERGSAENFGAMVKDVDAFVRHVGEHHGFALEEHDRPGAQRRRGLGRGLGA